MVGGHHRLNGHEFVLTIALLGKKREFYFPQFVNKKRGKVTVA